MTSMPPHPRRNHNRIAEILTHLTKSSVEEEIRLAREAGISRANLSRIMRGHHAPTFAVMLAITEALERRAGHPIDPRDILNLDGLYPTPSIEVLFADQDTDA
jgi:transcriptional regulator with XRE-family HTH domain